MNANIIISWHVVIPIATTLMLIPLVYFVVPTIAQLIPLPPAERSINPTLLPPPQNFTIYPNVTHKFIHKFGKHPCEDDPAVVCIGPYSR